MKADEILERVSSAQNFFSGLRKEFVTRKEYASGTYKFKLPDLVIPYRDITPVTNVDVAANAIVTDIPTFTIRLPHECTSADENRRDKQLRALQLLFKESEKQKIPPLRDSAINVAKYGAFCMSLWWVDESFDIDEWNFTWRSHNPENVLPIGENEFAEDYTIQRKDVDQLLTEFNQGRRKKVVDWVETKDTKSLVNIIKYYRSWLNDEGKWEGERAFFIDKIPIFQDSSIAKNGVQKNVLGVCPYVYGVSGWAGSSATGKPEEEARGINDLCFDVFNQISFLNSMLVAKLAKDVIAPYTQTVDDDQIIQGANIWDNIRVTSHEDLKPLEPRRVDPEAYNMRAELRQQVSDQTFGSGAKGVQQGSSGSQEAVLIGQDLKKMRVPRSQLETACEQICHKFLYIAKELGGVTYQGKTILTPDDIKWPINLDASLEPIDPVQQQAKVLMLKELWVSNAISWENFAARSGLVDDISLERKLIEINMIMRDPALMQIKGQKALEEWGMAEQINTLNAISQGKSKSNPANMGVYGQAATSTEVNKMRTQMGNFGGVEMSQMVPQEVQ